MEEVVRGNRLFNIVFLMFITNLVHSQVICDRFNECNIPDLGFADFTPMGKSVFCETERVILENSSTFLDFDQFIIDWGDERIDTINSYDSIDHVYDYSAIDRCQAGSSLRVVISFIGRKFCGDTYSCSEGTTTISVDLKPESEIDVTSEACVGQRVNFTEAACNEDPDSYGWQFGDGGTSTERNPSYTYNSPGIYQVSLRVENICGPATTTRSIRIVEDPLPEFDIASIQQNFCIPSEVTLINQTSTVGTINWNIQPNMSPGTWQFTDTTEFLSGDDSLMITLFDPRFYVISLNATNACGTTSLTDTIQAIDQPIADLEDPPAYCETANYTPDVSYMNVTGIESVSWSFIGGNPISSSELNPINIEFDQPGNYPVTMNVFSSCGNSTYQTEVVVFARIIPEIQETDLSYCSADDVDTLQVNAAGGTWSGKGIIDRELGIFDPSLVGQSSTNIRYEISNGECSGSDEITIEVKQAEAVSIDPARFCITDPPAFLTGSISGGVWSGEGVDSLGLFDPEEAGAGTTEVVYSVMGSNGCIARVQGDVVVDELNPPAIPNMVSLCRTLDVVDLTEVFGISSISGIIQEWSGPGIIQNDGLLDGSMVSEDTIQVRISFIGDICTVIDSAQIVLSELPELQITPDTTVCIASSTFQLNANIPGGTWSGPGIDRQTGIISIGANNTGSNIFRYIVNDGTNCRQELQTNITVLDLGLSLDPGPDESFCASSGIVNLTSPSPPGGTWSARPGLVDITTGQVDISLLTPGETYDFEYCISSQDIVGCTSCASKRVTINALPDPKFSTDSTFCLNQPTDLQNETEGDHEYSWLLNGNFLSSERNPVITAAIPGNLSVELTVTSFEGCVNSLVKLVQVVDAPVAQFDLAEDSGCAPFLLQIEDESSGYQSNSSWQINDREVPFDEIQSLVIDSLLADSTILISQIASNGCGKAISSINIMVEARPIAAFGFAMDEGCSPFEVTFENSSFGSPDDFIWDLGNGITSTNPIPDTQVYFSTGDVPTDYLISLIARNQCGVDTFNQVLTVQPPDVRAAIQLDTIAACPPFDLQLLSFSTAGSILNWEWTSPSGNRMTSLEQNPEARFDEPGEYTIILSAMGCGIDKDTAVLGVLPRPTAAFEIEPAICLGDTLNITNNSLQATIYEWTFDSLIKVRTDEPQYLFDDTAVHTIQLIAYNEFACPDTTIQNITVRPNPTLSLDDEQIFACPPFELSLQNNESGNYTYSWLASDGQTNVESISKFVFDVAGVYTVKAIATDPFGCQSTVLSEPITIYDLPTASFDLSQSEFCLGSDSLTVTNTSTGGLTYEWSLNGTFLANTVDLNIAPDQTGLVDIGLRAANEFGCADSIFSPLAIFAQPMIMPEFLRVLECVGNEINLSDIDASSEQYIWTIPGVTMVNGSNVRVQFEESGIYDLKIVAINGTTCIDSLEIDGFFDIRSIPEADFRFNINPDPVLIGDVAFSNESVNFTSLLWDFGDGQQSTEENPVHIYNINLPDSVRLTAFIEHEGFITCSDDIAMLIRPESVSSFYAPNALSPENGTGLVQVFKPAGLGIIQYDITIYSPWGEVVWYSEQIDEGQPAEAWDGVLPSGVDAPQGVYVYKANVTFSDRSESFTGTIHLIR